MPLSALLQTAHHQWTSLVPCSDSQHGVLFFCATISSVAFGVGDYEPGEGKAVKQSMNVLGLVLGIVSFLIFLAMAFCNVICAEPRDHEPRPHRKKLRHSPFHPAGAFSRMV
jgi:hypothetical protein